MNKSTDLGVHGGAVDPGLGRGAGPAGVDGMNLHGNHDSGSPTQVEHPAGGPDAQDGYQLAPATRTLAGGTFRFTITGPSGEPVNRYENAHGRELHLIVASRDLRTYSHLHPRRDDSGEWSADLVDLPPGPYRVFADFQPEGAAHHTLGVDATVPGEAAASTPLSSVTDTTVDGFDVELRSDVGSQVRIVVRRDGDPVVTEPYLGAAGHLVALREGDLAYLHVHPLDDEPRGPVRFAVDVPSAGVYALFFDFQVDGVVRTAHFVLDTDNPPPHSESVPDDTSGAEQEGDTNADTTG